MADALEAEIRQLYDDWIANPSAVVCARLADRLRLAGRIGEALDVASRGLEEWPASAQINLVCARCRRDSGENDLALESFQKVLSADPLNLVALRAVGEIAFEQKRYEDAERLLGDYLFENPADPEAEKLLGRVREMRTSPPPPAASPREEPAREEETPPSGAMPSMPRQEEVAGPVPSGTIPAFPTAGREPEPAAESVPEVPIDIAPFAPLVALAEPGEPQAAVSDPVPAPCDGIHATPEPDSGLIPPVVTEGAPAGASGTGDAGPVGTLEGHEAPVTPEPSFSTAPSAGQPPSSGFDWIRSAAGLDRAVTEPAETGPRASTDEPTPEPDGAPVPPIFPRTDRMERIIEAQTIQRAPSADPSALEAAAPAPAAPAQEPPASASAPRDRREPPRIPVQAQKQAMPRREPRSLLDLFSPEEREELGLEPFRQEEQ